MTVIAVFLANNIYNNIYGPEWNHMLKNDYVRNMLIFKHISPPLQNWNFDSQDFLSITDDS